MHRSVLCALLALAAMHVHAQDASVRLQNAAGVQPVIIAAIGPDGRTAYMLRVNSDGKLVTDASPSSAGSSVNFKGAYASGTTYAANDVVSYNGSSYIALGSSTGQTPSSSPSYWGVLALKGVDGTNGQGINFRGPWAATTSYLPYDVVTNGGSAYISTTSFTSSSTFNPSNWNLMAAKGADGANGTTLVAGTDYATPAALTTETNRATAAELANSIPDATVSTLPTATSTLLGRKYVVTDGVAGSVCSTGGGAVRAICEVYTVSTGIYGYRSVAQGAGEKGIANGIASLGSDGLVPSAQLPASTAFPASGASIMNAGGVLDVDSVVVTTANGAICLGDSITANQGPLDGLGYCPRMAADWKLPVGTNGTAYAYPVMYNLGVSGSGLGDQLAYLLNFGYSPAPTGNPIVTVAAGTNNVGGGTPNSGYISAGVALGVWAGLPSTQKLPSSAFTQTSGTWTADTGWSVATAMATSAAGTLTAPSVVVSKSGVVYVLFKQDVSAQGGSTVTGSFQVTADGGAALTNTLTGSTTVNLYGTGGASSPVYASVARFIVTPGTRSIAITWLSGKVSILPIAVPSSRRLRGINAPRLVIAGLPPQQNDANAAAVLAFQNGNLAISKQLVADGINAPFVDFYNNMDPIIDMTPSGNPGLHPSVSGAINQAGLIEAKVGATSPVYVGTATSPITFNSVAQPASMNLANGQDSRIVPNNASYVSAGSSCVTSQPGGLCVGGRTAISTDTYEVDYAGSCHWYSFPAGYANATMIYGARKIKLCADGTFDLGAGITGDANGVLTSKGRIGTPETITITSGSTTGTLSANTEISYVFLNNASATALSIATPAAADFGKAKTLLVCLDAVGGYTMPAAITNMVGVMDISRNGPLGAYSCSVQTFHVGKIGSSSNYRWIADNDGYVANPNKLSTWNQFISTPETVAFSATPTFSATTEISEMIVTANVTSSTLAAGSPGAHKTLRFCMASAFTVALPTNVKAPSATLAAGCNEVKLEYSTLAGYVGWYAVSPWATGL